MHLILTTLAVTATTTAKKKSSSSSSTITFLVILILFAGVYMLFIRPRQQRMKAQQRDARELSIGDTVVSAGGIQGTVVALDSDVAEVEVAPGVVLTFQRRAINPRTDNTRTGNPGTGAPRTSAPRPSSPSPATETWSVPEDELDAPPPTTPPTVNNSDAGGLQDRNSDTGQQDRPGEQPDQRS
jgi:preprotein translocase subunit YajC